MPPSHIFLFVSYRPFNTLINTVNLSPFTAQYKHTAKYYTDILVTVMTSQCHASQNMQSNKHAKDNTLMFANKRFLKGM